MIFSFRPGSRSVRYVVLCFLLMFVSACAMLWRKEAKQPFPHFRHHTVSCEKCHQPDNKGRMSLTPPVSACTFCHQDPASRPKMLAQLSQTPTYQGIDRHLIFSHTTHMKRVQGQTVQQKCGTCHGAMTSKAGGQTVPPMAQCLSCHEHKKEYDKMLCKGCHTDLRRFPLQPLSDYRHTPDFMRNHKRYAVGKLDLCVQCHDQPYCVRCHDPSLPMKPSLRFPEQVTQGMMHRGDYISRHAREARLQPTLCSRCHGPSSCETCHQQNAVLQAKKGVFSPHPPNYVRRGGVAFHGRDARRDPSRCQSCHDQGSKSNCVNCHRVGGIGGNPHPPGWRFGNRLDPNKNGMCRYCHQTTSR